MPDFGKKTGQPWEDEISSGVAGTLSIQLKLEETCFFSLFVFGAWFDASTPLGPPSKSALKPADKPGVPCPPLSTWVHRTLKWGGETDGAEWVRVLRSLDVIGRAVCIPPSLERGRTQRDVHINVVVFKGGQQKTKSKREGKPSVLKEQLYRDPSRQVSGFLVRRTTSNK